MEYTINGLPYNEGDKGWLAEYLKHYVSRSGNKTKTESKTKNNPDSFTIKKVYFNDPVTVVLWADGTKTIVRCGEDDIYDPEKGLAMAISKKALGNKGNYYNTFKKHLPEEEIDDESVSQFFADFFNSLFKK